MSVDRTLFERYGIVRYGTVEKYDVKFDFFLDKLSWYLGLSTMGTYFQYAVRNEY